MQTVEMACSAAEADELLHLERKAATDLSDETAVYAGESHPELADALCPTCGELLA